MAIGPVQLIGARLRRARVPRQILAELDRLKENDIVRVIDGLAVHKDAEGEVTVLKRTDLSDEEEPSPEPPSAHSSASASAAKRVQKPERSSAPKGRGGRQHLQGRGRPDVIEQILNDSAAAIILLEHRWAIPLRDAVVRTNGMPIADTFISARSRRRRPNRRGRDEKHSRRRRV